MKNMRQWVHEQIAAPTKRAMPILSFPGAQLAGVRVEDLVRDSQAQARAMCEVARRVPAAAAVSLMDLSVEAECFGAHVRFSADEVPVVTGAVVRDADEANRLTIPSVDAARAGIYLDAARQAAEAITDRPVFAGVIGPFSLAGRLMDVTEIMLSCYDIPDVVHATLEKTTSFLIAYCQAYKKAGANGIIMAEPLTGLLSPELAGAFSCGYVKRIIDTVQDDQFIVIYHNCGGSVPAMADAIFASGAAGYHFGNAVSMKEMLEHCPNDALCMGNIDPAGQFVYGTPEEMRAATFALLRECAPAHANFVISSGCDIPARTSWDTIDAFFRAVDDFYGRGPASKA